MRTVELSLTLVTCAMLAACGSSGGGGSDNSTHNPSAASTATNNSSANTNPNNSSASQNTSPSNNSTNNSGSANSSHSGNALVIKKAGNGVSITSVRLTDPSLSTVNVEGKVIQVAYPNIYVGSWSKMAVGDTLLLTCCDTYGDTRFGAYEGGSDSNAYFFHNGNVTQNMPTTGTASYNGYAVIAGQIKHFVDEDYLRGTSQFTADFANKTLSGTLNVDKMSTINVNANISNNDFTGTASSSDFSTSAKVDGKFYGDQAKELSGEFSDSKSWGGAFGAAK